MSVLSVVAQIASHAGQFTKASPMSVGRINHTATLLQNGKVLVTGGQSGSEDIGNGYSMPIILDSAELYDPVSDSWTQTGSLNVACEAHLAILLTNGTVLVAGGQNFIITNNGYAVFPTAQHLDSAEIYDPDTGTWTPTTDPPGTGLLGKPTLLADGRVFIAESKYGSLTDGVGIIYDPAAGSWATTSPGPYVGVSPSFTLANGLVLAGGGTYDPITDTWSPVNGGGIGFGEAPVLLTNGMVLEEGDEGFPENTSEIYDPGSNVWKDGPLLNIGRYNQATVALANGKALTTGGNFGSPLGSAELFDPDTRTWQMTGSMTEPRFLHSATLLADGKVLIVGGEKLGSINNLADAEIYDDSLPTPLPAPIFLTHAGFTPSGYFQFEFTNTPGVSFTVYSTPDFSRPFATPYTGYLQGSPWWQDHGEPVQISPGHYQFTDSQPSPFFQVYRVTSP